MGGGGGGDIRCDLAFPGAAGGSKGKKPVFWSAVGRSPPIDFFGDFVAASKGTKPVSGGVSVDVGLFEGGFGGVGGVNSVKARSAQVLT